MDNHVLVDLETMGCGSKAAIVSIGAVIFNPYELSLREEFYKVVSLESSMELGLEADASTIYWWLKQSEEARRSLEYPAIRYPISKVLLDFKNFYTMNDVIRFWCHGATFDAVILTNAYRLFGVECPFSHRDIRCTRTLFELVNMKKTTEGGIEHHALDDAKRHAKDVQTAYRLLDKGDE